jgi:hypothetical protein
LIDFSLTLLAGRAKSVLLSKRSLGSSCEGFGFLSVSDRRTFFDGWNWIKQNLTEGRSDTRFISFPRNFSYWVSSLSFSPDSLTLGHELLKLNPMLSMLLLIHLLVRVFMCCLLLHYDHSPPSSPSVHLSIYPFIHTSLHVFMYYILCYHGLSLLLLLFNFSLDPSKWFARRWNTGKSGDSIFSLDGGPPSRSEQRPIRSILGISTPNNRRQRRR